MCKTELQKLLQVLKDIYNLSTLALNELNWKNLNETLYYNEDVTMFKIVNLGSTTVNNRFAGKQTRYNNEKPWRSSAGQTNY